MKKLYFYILALFFLSVSALAQDLPTGFSYQAVVRDAAGFPKKGATVNLEFSLLPSESSDSPSWVETHQVQTDSLGICNAVIGGGTRKGGSVDNFANVDFGAASYWLQVKIEEGGTWVLLNKQQLLSVPYARVAARVVNDMPPVPVGTVLSFAGTVDKIPDGWEICDGEPKSINDPKYQTLFSVIDYSWGRGDNQMDFRLPDLRGQFLRGVSKDRNGIESENDPNRNDERFAKYAGNVGNEVGSYQEDRLREHAHPITDPGHQHRVAGGWSNGDGGARPGGGELSNGNLAAGDHFSNTVGTGITVNSSGGKENRPKNAYVYYIIKL